jgi:hypothetical protein
MSKLRILPMLLLGLSAAGCATEPKRTAKPYCYTSKDVVVKDGVTVSSETRVRCNDDPIETIPIKKMGISPRCLEHPYRHQLPTGRIVEGVNYVCQKRDGSWEIIDGRGINK